MRPKRPPPTLPKASLSGLHSADHFTAVAGPWWPPVRPRYFSKPKQPPPLLPPHVGPDWSFAPLSEQEDMAKLVGENSAHLVAWYAELPPSIVCLGWSCSKGNAVSEHLQRWFVHSVTASV